MKFSFRIKTINFQSIFTVYFDLFYAMKSFLTIVVITAFVALSTCKPQDSKKERTEEEKRIFKEWAATNKKAYKTLVEEAAALEIFMAHWEKVQAHNKLYDEGKVSYKQKLWEHSDMSPEDRRKFLHGLIIPPSEQVNKSKRDASTTNYPTGPASIDWKEKGLVGPVHNQGACSSCYAFSVAQVVEAFARKKNITAFPSPQQLVDCSPNTSGCNGGWSPYTMDYVVANGMTSSEQYPYKQTGQKCKYEESMKTIFISESVVVPTRGNETLMRDVMAAVGPIGMIFCIEESLIHYASGVYDPPNGAHCCDLKEGDHALIATGYGTDPVGGDYWIVKNTWGEICISTFLNLTLNFKFFF